MIDFELQVTLKRFTGAWVAGRYVKEATGDLPILISKPQPLRGNQVLVLPEHRRTEEAYKVFSEYELKTTDEKNNIPADVIVYKGKEFEVQNVADWTETDIPHYEVIIIKKNDQGGGNVAI